MYIKNLLHVFHDYFTQNSLNSILDDNDLNRLSNIFFNWTRNCSRIKRR